MKKHAIIPIFIPHRGCPNDCVFCNQRKITSRSDSVTAKDIHKTVSEYMSTLSDMNMETIELSFFGGSFTGIPMEEQREFLAVAKKYKDKGVIQKIHLSTRPDYINEEILSNLKDYGVDVIELGVQSFAEPVLKASNRGHSAARVYESCSLIKEYGFTLGIQLMIGLPEDTAEYDLFSAKEAVKLRPEIARLYPTVVIKDTGLYQMMKDGRYTPLSEKEAVERTAAMYKILTDAGINVIRVGLKSSDIMTDENNTSDTFHPAFRQLVEGLLARQALEKQIDRLLYRSAPPDACEASRVSESSDACEASDAEAREKDSSVSGGGRTPALAQSRAEKRRVIALVSNEKCRNTLFGHKSENKRYFKDKYTEADFRYLTDIQAGVKLADGEYLAIGLYNIKQKGDLK